MKIHAVITPVLLAVCLVVVFPLAVCSAETHTVEIKGFKFNPEEITIKKGDTIRWINKEKRGYHNAWFEQMGDPEPDYLFPEDTYDKTFNNTGEFPYRCGPHPEMTGIVHVTE